MDLYIGHNRPPFVEFGAELLPDFILRKDPNRCSEVQPRCSEPRTGSNALKRGQGALNAGRGDLNVRNNQSVLPKREPLPRCTDYTRSCEVSIPGAGGGGSSDTGAVMYPSAVCESHEAREQESGIPESPACPLSPEVQKHLLLSSSLKDKK